MDKNEVAKRLRDARNAIDNALAWIDAQPMVVADVQVKYTGAVCLYCGKPLTAADDVVRGVHRKPCYNEMSTLQRNGTKLIAQWESEGKLAPPKRPGRKKTALPPDGSNRPEK